MPSDSSEYGVDDLVDDPVPYDLDYEDTDSGTGDQDDETIQMTRLIMYLRLFDMPG
jgi:hypothetical protein